MEYLIFERQIFMIEEILFKKEKRSCDSNFDNFISTTVHFIPG